MKGWGPEADGFSRRLHIHIYNCKEKIYFKSHPSRKQKWTDMQVNKLIYESEA